MTIAVARLYRLQSAYTTAVFGNTPAAKADANYVGWLDPEDGVSGLDAADVMKDAEERVEGDGGVLGDFYHGFRIVTFNGNIEPQDPDTAREVSQRKLLAATNAMREDATLTWTEADGLERLLKVRRDQKPIIKGFRPKKFFIALIAEDARILRNAEVRAPGGAATYAFNAAQSLPQSGDEYASPRFTINGPITGSSFAITGDGPHGGTLRVLDTVGAGDRFEIDFAKREVLKYVSGVPTDVSGKLGFSTNEATWFELEPPSIGTTDVTVTATGTGNWIAWVRWAWQS